MSDIGGDFMKQTTLYTAHELIDALKIKDFDLYMIVAIGSHAYLHQEIATLYETDTKKYYQFFKESEYYNHPYLLSLCAANYRGIQQFSGIYLDEVKNGHSHQTLRLIKKGYKFLYHSIVRHPVIDILHLRDNMLKQIAKSGLDSTLSSFSYFTIILYLCRLTQTKINCTPYALSVLKTSFHLINQAIPLPSDSDDDTHHFMARYAHLGLKKKTFKLPLTHFISAIGHTHATEALKQNPSLKTDPEQLNTIAFSNDLARGINTTAHLLAHHNINIIDLENITPVTHASLTQLLALTSYVKATFQSPQPFEELLGTHLLLDALIRDYTAIKNNYLVNDYEENLIELNTLKADYSAKIDQLNTQEQTLLDNIATLKQQLKNIEEENTSLLKKLKRADNTVQSLQQQIKNLQQENHSLQARFTPKQEEDQPDTKTMTDYLMAHPCFLIGGHPTWQHALKQQLPTWHFVSVEDLNKNLSHLKKSDTLFFNDAYNSHAMYQKIKQTGATLHYCGNTTNLELTLKHLYEQLKNN